MFLLLHRDDDKDGPCEEYPLLLNMEMIEGVRPDEDNGGSLLVYPQEANVVTTHVTESFEDITKSMDTYQ